MNRKVILIVGTVIFALLIAIIGLSCGNWKSEPVLRVLPVGERDVYVEYGNDYEELGADATCFLSHGEESVALEVAVAGTVDVQTLGVYMLKYTATYDDWVGTAYRAVHVVDTCPPVITLVADPEKYTLPTETYQEEGFSASDNHDGDITASVVRTETREAVTYTAWDSSGNVSSVERTIIYNDPIPPVIVLQGQQSITLDKGQTYQEPGFSATDNCDGDLTQKVTVTGGVNQDRPGKYTLIYTVQDSYENSTTVSRTVYIRGEQEEQDAPAPTAPETPAVPEPGTVVPNGKVIYLTFDDGPAQRTPELLDILKRYNVKATFFVVNTAYIDTIKRIAAEGHSLAIHTTTHRFQEIYASEDAFFNDIYTMQGIIKDLTGVETTLMRFPGGSSNTVSQFNPGIMTRLTAAVVEKGFQYFDWNVDSKDAGGAKNADTVFYNVINGVSKNQASVVLQHDIKGFSIDAVERIIIWGLENGYTFLPLDPSSPGCRHGVNN